MARTAKPDARRMLTRNVAFCTVGVTVLVSAGALFGAGESPDKKRRSPMWSSCSPSPSQ